MQIYSNKIILVLFFDLYNIYNTSNLYNMKKHVPALIIIIDFNNAVCNAFKSYTALFIHYTWHFLLFSCWLHPRHVQVCIIC